MLLSERNKKERTKWALYISNNLVATVHKAKDMGWAEKKVQVRAEEDNLTGEQTYTIEPFEKECGCPSILKYDDYFTPPTED